MRITNGMNYNGASDYYKVELQNEDGLVVRRENAVPRQNDLTVMSEPADTKTGISMDLPDKNKRLPSQEVLDFAVHSDLNSNRDLIGKDAPLENLDLKKAISDMQRDSILQEYQVFVQNPESEDGNVRRIIR